MKYFVVEGTFNEKIPLGEKELQKAIEEHLAFLQKGFDEGFILISGPKVDVGGGIIVVKSKSFMEVEKYLAKDPLKILGIQKYRVIEFKLYACQPMLENWFNA